MTEDVNEEAWEGGFPACDQLGLTAEDYQGLEQADVVDPESEEKEYSGAAVSVPQSRQKRSRKAATKARRELTKRSRSQAKKK